MPKKKQEDVSKSGSPGWMTTYSDLMSLLLTFFILLYSFSSLDAKKFQDVANALQAVLTGQSNITIFDHSPPAETSVDAPVAVPDEDEFEFEIQEVYDQVKEYLEKEGLDAQVSVTMNQKGILIDIKESVLFDLGKADIKQGSKVILDKLGQLIKTIDKDIVIEGHTDNLPINTFEFKSNWELSVIRAVNVLRYFVEVQGADPHRISATGYGEYQPIASNETDAGKAMNRRVNILLLVYPENETY
ncbi:MAG: OmpA family protein [Clostridiaceae bacterium]|nr:OmpA family protein [Clostridiaceae bacterium]